MYLLSRMFLQLGALALIYCLALFVLLSGPLALWAVAFIAGLIGLRRRGKSPDVLGSARWADADDLRRHGMIGGNLGLIIGRIATGRKPFERLRMLFSRKVPAKEVCEEYFGPRKRRHGQIVRISNAVHTVVFGPTGSGKNASCISPFLFTCPDSCVIPDFKGENAKLTAEFRRRHFGHRIVIVDPFHLVTNSPDTYNPLDDISADSMTAMDDCNDLAKALVVRTGEEREPHWNDSAEAWISAMLATVVQYGTRN